MQVNQGEAQRARASQAACEKRERHMPANLSTNLQNYLLASKPEGTETTQQPIHRPRKPPTPGIACAQSTLTLRSSDHNAQFSVFCILASECAEVGMHAECRAETEGSDEQASQL